MELVYIIINNHYIKLKRKIIWTKNEEKYITNLQYKKFI